MGLMSSGVFPDGRTGLSSLLDPILKSSSLSQSESELLATVSQSVTQTVRLGLEPLLVCVCVSAVSMSRLS